MCKNIFVILLIVGCTLLVANAQPPPSPQDRQLCARLNQRCQASAPTLGDRDDSVDNFNQQCRVVIGPTWRNVTRCQVWRAHCELTVIRCLQFSCRTVRDVVFPRRN